MSAFIDLRDEARAQIPALPEAASFDERLRAAARHTWLARMVNEYSSATVFEGLATQLRALAMDEALIAECEGFAREERRHGVLCGAVVEALGGQALAARPERDAFPRHDDAEPIEALLRNVLSICCLSETVAVALIGAERLEMPAGPLHDLLTTIYADEVGHARFGWRLVGRLVPTLSAELRRRLSRYLALAFVHLEEHELAHLPMATSWPKTAAALGLCDGGDARILLYETIDEVIIPGLAAAGLDARCAWRERDAARAA
jgi:hypothetical protein